MAKIIRAQASTLIVPEGLSRWQSVLGVLVLVCGLAANSARDVDAAEPNMPPIRDKVFQAKRIVLLGDSITASGIYAAYFDTWMVLQGSLEKPQLIVAGLPSETTSGLSEEGHAGGQFPRPDLHERLDRVLKLTQPDLVIACYGINCGIYQPLHADRFAKFREGMTRLHAKVTATGASIIMITPPFYDDHQARSSWSYNEVLDRYSEWLVQQRHQGWVVLDLHKKMTEDVARFRTADPNFTFQPDAVHPNELGHWYIAAQLIGWCGDSEASEFKSPQEMLARTGQNAELLSLVQERTNLLRDAYVSAAGHKRPGVALGLPISEAEARAKALTARIKEQLATGIKP